LFPDELRISLSPDRVAIERRSLALSLAGLKASPVAQQVFATGKPAGRGGVDAVLQVLATALESIGDRRCRASVVLDNSFVRYVLVPQSDLLSPEDEASVMRHCFQEVYGEIADQWELRVSPAPGLPVQVASGVDRPLLDGLRGVLAAAGVRLESIQPRLMAVCNEHRGALATEPAWLVLVEPGNACLGLITGGGLARLRSLRIDGGWTADLPALLEREACLAELDEMPVDVMLWHRDGAASGVPASASLRVRVLEDRLPPMPAADEGTLVLARG
jgi:hypothetical protein